MRRISNARVSGMQAAIRAGATRESVSSEITKQL
jgi:hypothetical protein